MMSLKGHAALVTGSTKGVGRAIAEAMAAAGADVVVHGRSRGEDADAVLDRCRSHGVAAEFVEADLLGEVEPTAEHVFTAAHEALAKAQSARHAGETVVDILVNNAGQYFDVPFLEMPVERFERTLRLNVTSGYFLTQRFARHWVDRSINGRVLFIGSINGQLAEQVSTAYDTSKGAVAMMVKTLCVALAPHDIRVNGLAPGLVRTPQTSWLDQRPEDAKWIAHHTPNGQIPDADVCGAGAVYLCSDEAWHVHGQMLMIDGGISAWQFPGRPSGA